MNNDNMIFIGMDTHKEVCDFACAFSVLFLAPFKWVWHGFLPNNKLT